MAAATTTRLVATIFLSTFLNGAFPKRPTIKVSNIEKCEADSANAIPWTIEINNADSNGNKMVDAEFDLSQNEFHGDKLDYSLLVDKFKDGDWEKDVYDHDGNFCEMIKKYVPKAWQKMIDTLEPRPISLCQAQQAVFKLQRFEILKAEVQIPPLYGKIRATLKVLDKKNTILCMVFEVDILED